MFGFLFFACLLLLLFGGVACFCLFVFCCCFGGLACTAIVKKTLHLFFFFKGDSSYKCTPLSQVIHSYNLASHLFACIVVIWVWGVGRGRSLTGLQFSWLCHHYLLFELFLQDHRCLLPFACISTSDHAAFHRIFRLGEEAEEQCNSQESQPEHAVGSCHREAGQAVGNVAGDGVCADACHVPGAVQLAQQRQRHHRAATAQSLPFHRHRGRSG